jgi:hypothetical protein
MSCYTSETVFSYSCRISILSGMRLHTQEDKLVFKVYTAVGIRV